MATYDPCLQVSPTDHHWHTCRREALELALELCTYKGTPTFLRLNLRLWGNVSTELIGST